MPHNRFFLDTHFHADSIICLEGDEAHHLREVMRKKRGELVECVNGKNQLAEATIESIDKKKIQLKLVKVQEKSPPGCSIILCQAIPRLNRLETIVEKGCELGMSELWLFPGSLSEKKILSEAQLKRLEMIIISALKQCGRLDAPKIVLKPPLLEWQQLPFTAYFGHPGPEYPHLVEVLKKTQDILFFTGPESGFSKQEEQHLITIKAKPVCLHPYILRTDTASIAALTLISAALMKY